MKKFSAVALLAVAVSATVWFSRPATAIPTAQNPQFLEKVETPCVVLTAWQNDGGNAAVEWAIGADAGTAALKVGGRYRVTTTNDVYLCRGATAKPDGTCIFVSSSSTGEEFSFSTKYDTASSIYGFAVGGNAAVSFCRIKTFPE